MTVPGGSGVSDPVGSAALWNHVTYMRADPTTIDTLRLSLVDTTAALAKGTLSSETLTVAFLAQIEAFEADLNAFTFLAEFALSKARTSDRLRRAGLERGALEGVRATPSPGSSCVHAQSEITCRRGEG